MVLTSPVVNRISARKSGIIKQFRDLQITYNKVERGLVRNGDRPRRLRRACVEIAVKNK